MKKETETFTWKENSLFCIPRKRGVMCLRENRRLFRDTRGKVKLCALLIFAVLAISFIGSLSGIVPNLGINPGFRSASANGAISIGPVVSSVQQSNSSVISEIRYASAHTPYPGCWFYSFSNSSYRALPCSLPVSTAKVRAMPITDQGLAVAKDPSYSENLNCDSSPQYKCWMGYEYSQNGPYQATYADYMTATSGASSACSPSSTCGDSFWIGLTDCTDSSCTGNAALVQSGLLYGDYEVTGYHNNQPVAFAEVFVNGLGCGSTGFCGITQEVSVGTTLTLGDYLCSDNVHWCATFSDSNGVYIYNALTTSQVGFSSFPYMLTSYEGTEITSLSQVPSTPISGQYLSIWTMEWTLTFENAFCF